MEFDLSELIVILVTALLLVWPKRLPELGRSLARFMGGDEATPHPPLTRKDFVWQLLTYLALVIGIFSLIELWLLRSGN